jgi:uncharacterized protein
MKVKVKMPEKEQRDTGLFAAESGINLGAPELREDTAFPKIVGYAAVFNVLSEPLFMGVREKIRPGAFAEVIQDDVRALVDHKPSMILGRNKAGTLRLNEDQHGLKYEIDPPDTSVGRDVLVSLRRRDLDQSSFGFSVEEEEYTIKNEIVTREIIKVSRLYDVSIVTYPAYPQTSVNVRHLWPDLEEATARTSGEIWFRDIKNALAPPRLMPQYERKLHQRRLDAIAQQVSRANELLNAKDVQAVIFTTHNNSWTEDRAKRWLQDHGFRNDKMEKTSSSLRFRQIDLNACKEGSFVSMRENVPRGVTMIGCERLEVS